MRAQETAQFDVLARDTAATVRATVRRWWLDGKDRPILHIEAERTFVGARPVIVHFSVPLSKTRVPSPTRTPQMEVGVAGDQEPRKARRRRQKARPAVRKTRTTVTKTRTAAGKTRAAATKTRAATKARPATRKARPARRANPAPQSRRPQKRIRSVSKKAKRASARR